MEKWEKIADNNIIEKTITALKKNGIDALVVNTKEEAKKKVINLIENSKEIMNMTSATLDAIGITEEIENNKNAVKNKLSSMDKKKQELEMKKLGAAPETAIGSVHAVTEDGNVIVVSATGSQLPAYSYGSNKVIWVVGAQKIVKNLEEGMKRINEYVFPLEDKRARRVYGVGSGINKILIINKEFMPDRITLIFVKEKLGF